ncbi:opine metallophore biosynthesis dehydrogenase [Fusobacterium necrophorum]|uniref:opine metallophore biosynthesis dehydrogenase n=1 Tax=Fusobacterium necrophorum TaxID=859 RepID=UPI002550F912|nr:opine metallophore biosynthesis dehydrogenase [Fusobacterium necrophorum]MDK4501314.1 opine metallophore biosynthesis dehydrogenase [Fusobacterium necrophorum]
MKTISSTLILGTGPVAIQTAINFKSFFQNLVIGMAGRHSIGTKEFFKDIKKSDNKIEVKVQNHKHKEMSGVVQLDNLFEEYEDITGVWDVIILGITNDSYVEVLKKIPFQVLSEVRTFIIISSCIGSSAIIEGFLHERGILAEIITFSTYYGDTKREKNLSSSTIVLTKNVKEKIYVSSTVKNSGFCELIIDKFKHLNIKMELLDNKYKVESKSISTYVHPSILMNKYALEHIFNLETPQKYIYKFFPEGPITQYVIFDMLEQLKEMRDILDKLNVDKFNFLQFINDDNYPVKRECLSRDDVMNFETFDRIKQEYLVYIRYASILVDAYSIPDERGRYFDFSAVPMQKIYKNQENLWCIPRTPKEDYYRIKLLCGIGKYFKIKTPTIDKLIKNYESFVKDFAEKNDYKSLSSDFDIKNVEEDVNYIISSIKTNEN